MVDPRPRRTIPRETVAGAFSHNGDSTEDRKFDSNVFHFLNLIKAYLILFAKTFTWFFRPFAMVGDEWESEGSIRSKTFQSSSHQLTIRAIAYDGLWVH